MIAIIGERCYQIDPGCPVDVRIDDQHQRIEFVLGDPQRADETLRLVVSDGDFCQLLAGVGIQGRNLLLRMQNRWNATVPALSQRDTRAVFGVLHGGA